ncbi:MAG: hypothetical protein M3336_00405 [Chloroflexota bacterium]|nr:hypothetical protein [Chloroflexota bacterium]
MSVLRWLPTLLVLLPWLFGPAAPPNDWRIRQIAAPTSFGMLDWETLALAQRVSRLWRGLVGSARDADGEVETLRAYFRAGSERGQLRVPTEVALEAMVSRAYEEQGLHRGAPVTLGRLFPPVLVALTEPPNVLVVAPRTELREASSVVLRGMDVAAQEQLEAAADTTGMVSLVAPIGGLATYPSMVLEDNDPERVLAAVAHEWLHQYLVFFPLGAGYWSSQQAREINETTADLVGDEIATALSARYQLSQVSAPATRRNPASFDFRAFMRETRLRSEELLAQGRVEDAEAYMRARGQDLRQRGYNIRKLNQAYFALYGSYGGGFAASPNNPIPALLRQLRERSASLSEFVEHVRGLTSVAELRATLGALPVASS